MFLLFPLVMFICVVGSQITELCLEFICYDPNYNYGSDDDDEFMETDMEDDEEELVIKNNAICSSFLSLLPYFLW